MQKNIKKGDMIMRNFKKIVAIGATAAMTMAMSMVAMASADVTIHFKNGANWENVGAWIYEGIGFTKNVSPKDACPAYCVTQDQPIWPGARMTAEANYDGWYSITVTYEDLATNGSIMIFNNLVGDTTADTSSGGCEDCQKYLEASGLTMNTSLKKQTPNCVIEKKSTATEYWCEYTGTEASTMRLASTAPASYVKKASTVINNAEAVATSKSSVKISWDKFKGAEKYNVFCYDSSKKKYVKAGSTTKTSITVKKFNGSALKTGKGYKFIVKAVKDSKSIAKSSAVYASPLATPTLKSAKNSSKGAVTVKVNTVSKASGYIIYRSTKASSGYVAVGTIEDGKVTFVDREAKKGKTYYYKAAAYRNVSKVKAVTTQSTEYIKVKVTK